MEEKKSSRICKNIMIWFLAAMAVFTCLSRVLDSVSVPKVTTGGYQSGAVLYDIIGDGTFVAEGENILLAREGLRIGKVEKKAGDTVKAGDVIFSYQAEGLEEKQRETARLLEKQKLELEQLIVQEKDIAGLTDEELAIQALDTANRALKQGQEDAETQRRKADEKIEDLRKKYENSMKLSEAEMEEETRRSYKNAERAYDAAVKKKENAVKRAERSVSDWEKKVERLEEEDAPAKEIEAAEDALEAARENLEQVLEEQDLAVEEAQAALREAEQDYGDVTTGGRSAAESLTSSFEAAVEAEKEKVAAKEADIRSLEEAVRQAGITLENARKRDASSRAETARQKEVLALQRQAKELDIEETARQLEEYNRMVGEGGTVVSPLDGILTGIEVETGKTASGEERITIGGTGLKLKGYVDRKLGTLLAAGTKLTAIYGDKGKEYEGTVETVEFPSGEREAVLMASFGEAVGAVGASASFTIHLKSQPYETVIPISALRQDNKGYYVLVTETEKTILGEELKAVRLDVEVLEKSSSQAAVSGALGRGSRLILGSNKTIEAGDRVREAEE